MTPMTRRTLLGSLVAFGLAVLPTMAQHEGHGAHGDHGDAHKTPSASASCPVSGEAIDLSASVATDDGPVFFCCKDCIAKYKADPAKYAEKVALQRKALADRAKVQVTCPVSKEPVDPAVSVESGGTKVYFCCKSCVKKYEAEPAKYASALANSYTYQTKCPVMGEEIDPKAFTTTGDGMKVYFCCKGCDKKFNANPAKYAANMAEQGFTVDSKEKGHDAKGKKDHNDE